MRITIAERLRPYIHRPGVYCLLPGSTLRLQVFPGLLRVYDLASAQPMLVHEIPWNIVGPVKDFTVMQDLEKGCVRIWGKTQTGFMRYSCYATGPSTFAILLEKNPQDALRLPQELLSVSTSHLAPIGERLSLGNNKAQDWELIQRRQVMEEIFPHWFRLGQWVPSFLPTSAREGTLALLFEETTPEKIIPAFEKLFQAGFEGLLAPRLEDEDYQGMQLPTLSKGFSGSALQLLTEGTAMIRRLFVLHTDKMMHLLPSLPPEFHYGRLIGIQWPSVGVVDIEWSKKRLRRMVLRSQSDNEVQLQFSHLETYRLRKGNRDRGSRRTSHETLKLLPNEHYFLDNFQQ